VSGLNPHPLAVARLHNGLGRRLSGLPTSFPEHVRELIEDEIVSGRLPVGERVTEESLAQRFGVSRTPVREAMRTLEGQGLITTPGARGTYISRRMSREEARALFGVRIELEGFLTARAAGRIDEDGLQALEETAAGFELSLDADDTVRLRNLRILDSDFHWTIYNTADSLLTSVVASYWARLERELYDHVYSVEHPRHYATEHRLLVAVLREGDAQEAQRLMREHLRGGVDALDLGFGGGDEA
jgi:DNA-binding GntR family transcriptional regulator